MKTFKKILYISSLFAIAAVIMIFKPEPAALSAQSCNASSTPGNLYGYISSNIISTPIYLSTETWNDDPLGNGNTASTVDFYVNFDRTTSLWSGRAWNETVGWIEFDIGSLEKKAYVEDALANLDAWGYWDGMIDLSNVEYSTNAGGFNGIGISSDLTGDGSDLDDVYVGLGELEFSNVSYIESPCGENINLFLNGTPVLYNATCPISAPTIKWTSENVSSCVTDTGPWGTPTGARATQNTTGETASAGLSAEGSQIFRLKCVGDISGASVYGTAIMSCGAGQDPTDGLIVPNFTEE